MKEFFRKKHLQSFSKKISEKNVIDLLSKDRGLSQSPESNKYKKRSTLSATQIIKLHNKAFDDNDNNLIRKKEKSSTIINKPDNRTIKEESFNSNCFKESKSFSDSVSITLKSKNKQNIDIIRNASVMFRKNDINNQSNIIQKHSTIKQSEANERILKSTNLLNRINTFKMKDINKKDSNKHNKKYFQNLRTKKSKMSSNIFFLIDIILSVFFIFLNIISIFLFIVDSEIHGVLSDTTDFVFNLLFLAEYILNFIFASQKIKYFINLGNIINLISFGPSIINYFLIENGVKLNFLRVFRLIRIFRLLKVITKLKELKEEDKIHGFNVSETKYFSEIIFNYSN